MQVQEERIFHQQVKCVITEEKICRVCKKKIGNRWRRRSLSTPLLFSSFPRDDITLCFFQCLCQVSQRRGRSLLLLQRSKRLSCRAVKPPRRTGPDSRHAPPPGNRRRQKMLDDDASPHILPVHSFSVRSHVWTHRQRNRCTFILEQEVVKVACPQMDDRKCIYFEMNYEEKKQVKMNLIKKTDKSLFLFFAKL